MDYKYIEQLLERYWQGETSLQEEAILRSFFSQVMDTGMVTEMDGTPSRTTSRMVVPASVTPPLSATTSL